MPNREYRGVVFLTISKVFFHHCRSFLNEECSNTPTHYFQIYDNTNQIPYLRPIFLLLKLKKYQLTETIYLDISSVPHIENN